MKQASKENNVTYMGQDLYKVDQNKNWQNWKEEQTWEKYQMHMGTRNCLSIVIGMHRSQPGRIPQYKVLYIVCNY